ncbi:MAG: CGNR zinc finger domain-containing protein [Vicinamibacteria bacterium]
MLPAALRDRPAGHTKLVGGRLCLDFANSVRRWPPEGPDGVRDEADERLGAYADLLAWSGRVGALDEDAIVRLWREAERRPEEARAAHARARLLRDAVYAIGWSLAHGRVPRPADLSALEAEVLGARARQRLAVRGRALRWQLPSDERALDRPLAAVALSADEYFTSGDLSRLHVCPGDDCGWLFEDTTRNRSRQWCDMGDCGNLAKVRRFRSKAAGPKRPGPNRST